jgi:hypothetical protein
MIYRKKPKKGELTLCVYRPVDVCIGRYLNKYTTDEGKDKIEIL